ncbi:MAG: hypothetical protein E7402_01660 [Ruminococcaceae bacterium]|nr:hypothetical protein [Oscillospiraceae bacterium]
MSFTVNFMDNENVTAEALNTVSSELGGEGLAFQEDVLYGVDALNDISKALITKGVSRGCELSASDGMVTIGEGVLFMSDGRRVEIDSDGISLSYTPGTVCYVYFRFDSQAGIVIPCCTETEPEEGDLIRLGYITTEGAVAGRVDRALMKNAFLGLHGAETFHNVFKWDGQTEEALLWELDLSDTGYRYVMVSSPGYVSSDLTRNAFCGQVNLADQKAFSVLRTNARSYADEEDFIYNSDNGEVLAAYALNESVAGSRYYYVYLRFEMGADQVLRVYQRAVSTKAAGYIDTKSTTIEITVC